MEFKGTHGEWYVSGIKYPCIESKSKNIETIPTIATVNSTFRTVEESRYNALLMSKAPEMLEMLDKIQALFNSHLMPTEEDLNRYAVEINQLISQATEL